MRILWTLLKVIIGLAIAIPVGIVLLGLTVGVIGTVLSLMIVAVRLACVGLVGYGIYRLARRVFGSSAAPAAREVRSLPTVDPYYEAAMRELDSELRHPARG